MPRTKRKGKGEPLYTVTARTLGRAWGRLRGLAGGFWHDLTQARGHRYFRALAIFCVLCVLFGAGASAVWRTAAVQSAVVRYRAVFLGTGATTPAESPPPVSEAEATPPAETEEETTAPQTEPDRTDESAGAPDETEPPAAGDGPAAPVAPDLSSLIRPVVGAVTLDFGWQYFTTLEDWRFHPGVDIQAPEGTAVRAALSGIVADVAETFEYGLKVRIDHGAGYTTVYGQLGSNSVDVGDSVSQGQQIGVVAGPAGVELEDGPHLHFELWSGDSALDPHEYWK